MQDLDSRLDALRHQRASIPEIERARELAAERDRVNDKMRDFKVLVDDLSAEQKKADHDVESVKQRRERDQSMIDSGAVSAKDMENLVREVASLERRISDLEDVELEVMERLEEAQLGLEAHARQIEEISQQGRAVVVTRDEKAKAIDAELAEVTAEREKTVEGIPADLMALYARLREQKGGVGAAALRARECGGCRLTLDASMLRDIKAKAPDDVVRCEECSRILVRTNESGL